MMSLDTMIQAVRDAASRSEPIGPLERRATWMLILVVLAAAWALLWARQHLEEKTEALPFGTGVIWVSLPVEDADHPGSR